MEVSKKFERVFWNRILGDFSWPLAPVEVKNSPAQVPTHPASASEMFVGLVRRSYELWSWNCLVWGSDSASNSTHSTRGSGSRVNERVGSTNREITRVRPDDHSRLIAHYEFKKSKTKNRRFSSIKNSRLYKLSNCISTHIAKNSECTNNHINSASDIFERSNVCEYSNNQRFIRSGSIRKKNATRRKILAFFFCSPGIDSDP